MNLANNLAVGRKHTYSVEIVWTPPCRGPHVSVHIAAYSVGTSRRHIHKHAAILQTHTINNVIDANLVRVGWMLWNARIDDVKKFFVRRKTETVRFIQVADNDGDLVCFRVE